MAKEVLFPLYACLRNALGSVEMLETQLISIGNDIEHYLSQLREPLAYLRAEKRFDLPEKICLSLDRYEKYVDDLNKTLIDEVVSIEQEFESIILSSLIEDRVVSSYAIISMCLSLEGYYHIA